MSRVALYLQDSHDLREGMECVQYAESRGFEAVWQAESRLVRDAVVPMAAYAAVAGSAVIGKNCILAGNAGVVGHISIADGVQIMAKTLVTSSIKESGSYSSGTPCMPTADWRKSAVRFSQLDKLARQINKQEK